MKEIFLMIFFVLSVQSQLKSQVAADIVLAEVYGGGGEQGSYWTNDYILLFNPTESVVDLSTWSIQYAMFHSWHWHVIYLNGSISANSYYFIQLGGGSAGRSPLPFTPDVVSNININKLKGKLALTNFQNAITVSNPVGQNGVIDFIGYGNGTNAFEGSGPAAQTSTTESIRRKDNNGNNTYGLNGNGWDSNDNSEDFYVEDNLIVNQPLPVELSLFTAKVLRSGGVKLDWRTETEVSNYGFEIERSENLKSEIQNLQFEKIGFVEGNGNSNSPKDYSFEDRNAQYGSYAYRLKQIDTDGQFEYSKIIEVNAGSIPDEIVLEQNYPNPFNPSTTIKFVLSETQKAELKVYDILGYEVVTLFNDLAEGNRVYEIEFNALDLAIGISTRGGYASGVYFYRLETANKTENRKMLLIK